MRTLLLLAALVTSAAYSPMAHASPTVAAFLGDSYTEGYLAPPGARWSTLVAEREGWDERNFGVGGTGYATSSKYGLDYSTRVNEIADTQPDIVVVSGGVNDYDRLLQDPASTSQAVVGTYRALRARLPDTRIVAIGPTFGGSTSPELEAYTAVVQSAAAAVGAQFIALTNPYVLRDAMFLQDGLHLDEEGHRAIANRVIAGVEAGR